MICKLTGKLVGRQLTQYLDKTKFVKFDLTQKPLVNEDKLVPKSVGVGQSHPLFMISSADRSKKDI